MRRHQAEREAAPVVNLRDLAQNVDESPVIEVVGEERPRIDAVSDHVVDHAWRRNTRSSRHDRKIARRDAPRYRPIDVNKGPGTSAWPLVGARGNPAWKTLAWRLSSDAQLVLESHEVRGPRRLEVRDDRRLVLRARQQRLPGRQMLEAVEVAARDRCVPRARDPREQRVPVEELEPIDELGQLRLRAEGRCRARRADELLRRIRVRGDERRPFCT